MVDGQKENPLTPRVTVNRYWQTISAVDYPILQVTLVPRVAGRLIRTFLNWLAADFIEHDWDVKRMIKKLVTSATYRQSSLITQDHLKKDPQNLYFARAPRFRIMGEFVRDQALYVSGLLAIWWSRR